MASIEDKKAFLRQYLNCVRAEKGINDEIETLRASAMLPAIAMDGMPHGTNKSDLSSYMAMLDDLMRKLNAELKRKRNARAEIMAAIEKLPNETEKLVLKFRYINGWKWERIAEETYYSYQHIHKIHGKALQHLEIP